MELIAELSTNHGGDVSLACEMIHAAAAAGANIVKTQSYTLARLNRRDSQAAWLAQSHLSVGAHRHLMACAADAEVSYLSTPFDSESLSMLRNLGLTRFKVASSESSNTWWLPTIEGEHWYISYPWGDLGTSAFCGETITRMTAIPLYPTPLECVSQAPLLDGWSDHTEGLSACYRAITLGAKVIEVHMKLPGKGRECSWDKTPDDIKHLRAFADDCETMQTGVAQRFRERWSA